MAKRVRTKSENRALNADKRPRAVAKYVRISPDKVRIVLDVIRGKSYVEAIAILKNTRKAAIAIYKAVSNIFQFCCLCILFVIIHLSPYLPASCYLFLYKIKRPPPL